MTVASAGLALRVRRAISRAPAGILALIAGVLAALAFPPFGFWPGLLGFALLLRLLDDAGGGIRGLRAAFLRGWCAGFGYFLVSTWWVGEAFLVDMANHGWQAPFAIVFLAGGLALLWGTAALVYRFGAPAHLGRAPYFAAVFSIFEWLRGHILTGFPWDLPGEAWRAGSPLSQGAAALGAYGMTFITLAAISPVGLLRRSVRGEKRAVLIGLAVLAAFWIGGAWRLQGAQSRAHLPLRLRIVQVDVPQTEKWSPEAFQSIVLRYVRLTARPAPKAVDIVLWPEGAIPDTVDDLLSDGSWTQSALAGALSPGQILLMGTARIVGSPAHPVYYNSMIALRKNRADLQLIGQYDKHHLVPFGEYMPFDRLAAIIGFKTLVHIGDGFTSGPKSVALSLPGLDPVQPLICYEGLFPGSFARSGPRPRWIANLSNDAWFGDTSGPWQHLNLSSYRAIEEGLPLIRATPTGVSAVIDAYGRPLALLALDRAGIIDADLPEALQPTLFDYWRDGPFWLLCVLACAAAFRYPAVYRTNAFTGAPAESA